MTANSVTGSFRGIEVSFSYNGPHIIMSVLNKAEAGRQLRVMYQQQPLGGRVNWISFQLTGQTQDVLVPTEVIQSHRLAFYVDSHEPISTYTEKILEELKLIQDQQLPDDQPSDTASEDVIQSLPNSENGQVEAPEKQSEETAAPSKQQPVDNPNSEQKIDAEPNNGTSDLKPQGVGVNPSENGNYTVQQDNTPDATTPEKEPTPPKPQSTDEPISAPKRKTQYVGQYIPSINRELQFKIKVPSFPKSASKKQATFIPPRYASTSKSKDKDRGFFGQLAGAFGLTIPKKKEYYVQQNRHLYEKFHANLEKLESDYNNGYGIPLENWDLESLDERQTAVLLLNLMVNELGEWKKKAKQGNPTKKSLAESLETFETELKQALKQTRGIQAPAPTLFPDRTAATDQDLMDIQKDCDIYLERFSEKLAALEQQHAEKVKIPAFKKFLVEFVRDKLFPNVVEFSPNSSVQSRLNWFLDLVDYELMPIEPGKTKFSSEHHEVKEKRSSDFESDTIIEVVSPGLQSKDGKRVIQNAVVVQAE